MWSIKLIGCVLLVGCCSLLGIKASSGLAIRVKSLEKIKTFLLELKSSVRLTGQELPELFKTLMPVGVLYEEDMLYLPAELCLNDDDRELLEGFLKDLGMADITALEEKINAFICLLDRKINDAGREKSEKSQLYKICGFSIGCIASLLLI